MTADRPKPTVPSVDAPPIGRRAPQACTNLAEARTQIDRIDAGLLALLTERQAYLDVVATFKTGPGAVRDPARVEAVIERVRRDAVRLGLDGDLAESVWRAMLEAAAVYQEGRLRQKE